MVHDNEVTLCWVNKSKDIETEVNTELVRSSVIHPNPIFQTDNLFEPWLTRVEDFSVWPDKRIMQGDNLPVLHSLIETGHAGTINLIYIDPPYLSQSHYISRVLLQDGKHREWLDRSIFKDNGIPDLASYLHHLYVRLVLMRELLNDNGSIFVHLDWHVCHYVKILMDEIFGPGNFINEIVWCYTGGSGSKRHFHRKHDIILWYAKGSDYTFNPQFRNYSSGTLQRGLTRVKGERFHLHEEGAMMQDWWVDINKILSPTAYENLKFPTQKPVALLERLIACASNPGDTIADFYAGSGTLAEVCEKNKRNWICCDNNRLSIQTMLYRLIEMQAKDFRCDLLTECSDDDRSDMPKLELKGPKIQTGGEEYNWLEIGINDYSPYKEDNNKLKNEWPWPILIDFWEIDLNYHDDCFRSCRQIIRSQHRHYDMTLPVQIRIPIPHQETYRFAIRVHDIFGNQTTKIVQ